MKKDARINFNVPVELRDAFREKIASASPSISISDVLRGTMYHIVNIGPGQMKIFLRFVYKAELDYQLKHIDSRK